MYVMCLYVQVIMLQNVDVQRRLYERKSDDVSHRLRDSEISLSRYQVPPRTIRYQ